MILGIGVDCVAIDRFSLWHQKPKTELLKLLHPEEIAYCLAVPAKSAERFAARFAAREAFFKAVPAFLGSIPFLTLCKQVYVAKLASGQPVLHVEWEELLPKGSKKPIVHLSLTHTQTTATAFIVVEKSP